MVWFEDGKWVTQTQPVVFKAGDVHCIDIVPASQKEMMAEIVANLAKLGPEDRKLADQQRFCAVQNDKRLGEMGMPVKILVKGQPVFLCCSGCEKTAQANADRTLAKVAGLRAKTKATMP